MSKGMTPIRTIREKCLDCCGYQWSEVTKCGAVECPLWPYRHGHRPTMENTEKHLQEKAALDERNRLMKQRLKKA
jgi:hypothetical protein